MYISIYVNICNNLYIYICNYIYICTYNTCVYDDGGLLMPFHKPLGVVKHKTNHTKLLLDHVFVSFNS